jgi:hypothetical protein
MAETVQGNSIQLDDSGGNIVPAGSIQLDKDNASTQPGKAPLEPTFRETFDTEKKETWGEAMEALGAEEKKTHERMANGLIYSEMLSVAPSILYEHEPEITPILRKPYTQAETTTTVLRAPHTEKEKKAMETPEPTFGESLEKGFHASIIGMMAREKVPEPFESTSQFNRWAYGMAEMVPDIIPFLAGMAIGGGPETPAGWGGGFGLTMGMKQVLMDRYEKGEVKNLGELLDRTKAAGIETIKGELIGGFTGPIGKVGISATLPAASKALLQLGTMVTASRLVEGQVPTNQDFIDSAPLLLPLGLAHTVEAARNGLAQAYVKDSVGPKAVAEILARSSGLTGEEQNQVTKPGLKPALKIGKEIITGEEGETHPDIEKKLGIPIQDVKTAKAPAEEARGKEKGVAGAELKAYEDYLRREYGDEKSEELGRDEKVARADLKERVAGDVAREEGASAEEAKALGDWFEDIAVREKVETAPAYQRPWAGIVDTRDGAIVKKYSYKQAQNAGFRHTELIDPRYYDAMREGTQAFFWLDETGTPMTMEQKLSPELMRKIKEQMASKTEAPVETEPQEPEPIGEKQKKEVQPERGFTDPDGKFYTREQAEKWVKENEPDVHDNWQSMAGEGAEFHSEDYNAAREKARLGNAISKIVGNEKGEITLDPAIQMAREALDKMRESGKASRFGEALRLFFVGRRNAWVAEAAQLRDMWAKIIPDYQDQEALSLLRDFKNKRDELIAKRDQYVAGDDPELKKVVPIIDRALNPSPELLEVDRQMTEFFKSKLEEGKRLGFLDSTLTPEEYITHLLEPEEMRAGIRGMSQGKISRHFQFAKERYYATVLDALEAEGVKVKTFNALDAMTIYADKHATAASTRLLIEELKKTNMGKFGTSRSENMPADWVLASPSRELFKLHRAILDKETGEPIDVVRDLYVPPIVQKALAPIIDPATIANVPGFRAGRMYQAYIKSVELGLSIFHMKALNITALNNERLSSLIKSYASDMNSPAFQGEEVDFIKYGGTTSILGRTVEAYRAAQPSTFPSRLDILRNKVVIKQIDQFAAGLTHETFDVMQRKFKVMDYSLKKAAWIADHPDATPAELVAAKTSIAKEINAAYGGLNWEVIGVNKNTRELTKAIMLAPDWVFSNIFNLKYAFEGGEAGVAARKFWIKSAVTGIVLSEAMSISITGKGSKHPTEVFLGNDKDGKEVYVNMFFAGAPKDFISLIDNVNRYGAVLGVAHSITNKLGPLARTGMQILTNTNWMGQPIVRKEESFLKKTGKGALYAATQTAPIPFSISNIATMLMNDKIDYTMRDYIFQLGGTPPRHELPEGEPKGRKRYTIRGDY